MSVTTNKFRILGSSNLNGSTKCASYGNDVLMIDTSGVGIYLGNDTSKPTLIADNGEGKYLKNSGGTLAGNVTPGSNNTYSLGTNSLKWSNVYATTFTGNLTGTASIATKLGTSTIGSTTRPIYINAGTPTTVNSINEHLLSWTERSNNLNCTGTSITAMAAMPILSSNRLQFARPAGITIEYSTDGGATWVDYGLTDSEKINFVSGKSVYIKAGKGLSALATANDKVRITIHATNAGVYTKARALMINLSTNGSIANTDSGVKSCVLVDIETAKRASEDLFTLSHSGLILSGWSGWNQIPLNGVSFGGGTTQTSNTGAIRLTFSSDGAGSSYTSGAHFTILDLYLLGDTYWNTPSNWAKTGHLYDYNSNQDMILPNNIYATNFVGHHDGTILMTAGTANAYRDILVTNGSNGICYSSKGNVQLNYSTGDVKATSFTGKLIGNATSADSVPELTEAEIADIVDNSFILIAGSGGGSGMGIDDALIDESSFEEGDNE